MDIENAIRVLSNAGKQMASLQKTGEDLRNVCVNYSPFTAYYATSRIWTLGEVLTDWVILRNVQTPDEAKSTVDSMLAQIAKMEQRP